MRRPAHQLAGAGHGVGVARSRRTATALLALVLLLSSAAGAFAERAAFAEASAPRPEFFVFDNGAGRGSWTPDQQAQTLKDLGYDGISYNYTTPEDLARWQKAFAAVGLKIYGLYLYTYIDRAEAFDVQQRRVRRGVHGARRTRREACLILRPRWRGPRRP